MSPTDTMTAPAERKSSRSREEEVARRAYELYLMRGAAHGCDLQDWLQAEREVGENN